MQIDQLVRHRLLRALLAFVCLNAFGPLHAAAQTIRGEVVGGAESLLPLEGSIVVLLAAAVEPLLTALTSSDGRFLQRAPRQGSNRPRVDRIGCESALSDAFDLGAAEGVFRRLETRAHGRFALAATILR